MNDWLGPYRNRQTHRLSYENDETPLVRIPLRRGPPRRQFARGRRCQDLPGDRRVLEVTATTITVQKGNDKWELARNSNTKIKGDLKVGSKVTIYYTMVAAEVEVKEAKGKK